MSEREPALLGDEPHSDSGGEPSQAREPSQEPEEPEPAEEREEPEKPEAAGGPEPTEKPAPRDQEPARRGRPETRQYHAAGFWQRLVAGMVDLAVITPVATFLAWLVGKLAGFGMPPNLGIDYSLDLLLGSDPSMVTLVIMLVTTATLYAGIFQVMAGRTLGMRLFELRVIDVYGDPPSLPRAAIRTAGYLANLVTLGLGFIWIGFDSEKRGLHDWIAGTYVVKARG